MRGFLLVWPSGQIIISTVLIAVLTHVMVLTEEEHLIERFGATYQAYCKRVPRYV